MAEKCPNLTHLNLSGNKIKDLSTIEPLVSHLGPSPPQGGRWEGLVSGTTTFTFVECCFSVVPPAPCILLYLTLVMGHVVELELISAWSIETRKPRDTQWLEQGHTAEGHTAEWRSGGKGGFRPSPWGFPSYSFCSALETQAVIS